MRTQKGTFFRFNSAKEIVSFCRDRYQTDEAYSYSNDGEFLLRVRPHQGDAFESLIVHFEGEGLYAVLLPDPPSSGGRTQETSRSIVVEYWRLMAANDFWAVGAVLADDFVLEWPQSNERIRGRENLARMNTEYPSHGPWRFTINKMVASVDEVVTDVSVTDGVQRARAISFFTIRDGKIVKIIEHWPEPYEAPENRRHLVERIED